VNYLVLEEYAGRAKTFFSDVMRTEAPDGDF